MNSFKFKEEHSLEERQKEAQRILTNCPNRAPVICEPAPNSNLPALKRVKYLVPGEMTLNQFNFTIRKGLNLSNDSALYLLSNNQSLTGNMTMRELYQLYKDKEDRFLYIYYDSELTWG